MLNIIIQILIVNKLFIWLGLWFISMQSMSLNVLGSLTNPSSICLSPIMVAVHYQFWIECLHLLQLIFFVFFLVVSRARLASLAILWYCCVRQDFLGYGSLWKIVNKWPQLIFKMQLIIVAIKHVTPDKLDWESIHLVFCIFTVFISSCPLLIIWIKIP